MVGIRRDGDDACDRRWPGRCGSRPDSSPTPRPACGAPWAASSTAAMTWCTDSTSGCPRRRIPRSLTIHDVVPWRFPDEGRAPRDAADSARRAAVVICPSQFSADEVASQLGVDSPVAIHNGVDPRFFGASRRSDESQLAGLGIRPPFVLHAGGLHPAEEPGRPGRGVAPGPGGPPGTQLVLVGPPDDRRDRLFGPLPGTVPTGRVDDAAMPGVMAAAAVVVVPSDLRGIRPAGARGHGGRRPGGGGGRGARCPRCAATPPTWSNRTGPGWPTGWWPRSTAARRLGHGGAGPGAGGRVHLGGERRGPRRPVAIGLG